MAIYNITSEQLKGAGILNSFEIPVGGGGGFTNTRSIEGDGVDAYVDCGTNSSLNFERTDTFSYSLWVKRNVVNTTNHMLLSKMNPSGNRRGMFFNLNSESKIVVMLRTDTSYTSQRLFWKTNNLINDTTDWHHVVFTFDGSSTVGGGKIYIDGVAATFDVADGSLSASIQNPAAFLIMAMSTAPLLPADVIMDEVAVFDSELSASDVTSIYNGGGSGKPGDLTSLNPVSWWRFEEGSGTSAADSGSASNTGTLENSATFNTDVP